MLTPERFLAYTRTIRGSYLVSGMMSNVRIVQTSGDESSNSAYLSSVWKEDGDTQLLRGIASSCHYSVAIGECWSGVKDGILHELRKRGGVFRPVLQALWRRCPEIRQAASGSGKWDAGSYDERNFGQRT